ncbi:unnamed protein product [Rodentolepis nana]|uniref:Cadherin domain-containing protein n=1 Tax=Rodentolepis nana TaxID=102285 RepID=A0A0R3T4H6_RODNA|nr:unnamed protein product [Rodentolepis nana]
MEDKAFCYAMANNIITSNSKKSSFKIYDRSPRQCLPEFPYLAIYYPLFGREKIDILAGRNQLTEAHIYKEQLHLQTGESKPLSPKTKLVDSIQNIRTKVSIELHDGLETRGTVCQRPINQWLGPSVDSRTGDIKVKQDLDRETLCQKHRQCCGVVDCRINVNVVVIETRSKSYWISLKLVVKVNDVNDNRPSFSSDTQRVTIPENSEVGKLIGLRPAVDSDVDPRNQITRYQWSEPTDTFSLDQSNLPAIRLRLNAPIDRELRANYSGILSACDIDYCTSIEVLIEIEDVNDNFPTFPNRRYQFTALESFPPGNTILKLNASDADSGENARIFYSFHELVDLDLIDTFEIVPNTGEIRLRRPLDAKIRGYYNFKVVACNTVATECTGYPASNVEVQIDVKDANDNRPIIEIVPSGEMSKFPDDLVVQENAPPGQIAVVRVEDADIGENARTSCDLDSQSAFELTHSAQDLYSLRTIRSFDYEQETQVTTTIRCHDYGIPRLNSTRTINLRIQDVNEYPPEFPMRVYSATVMENSPPGVEITSLAAVDRDGQAELQYTLAPPPLQEGGSKDVNKHFNLDPKSGVLRTSGVSCSLCSLP